MSLLSCVLGKPSMVSLITCVSSTNNGDISFLVCHYMKGHQRVFMCVESIYYIQVLYPTDALVAMIALKSELFKKGHNQTVV